MGFLAFVVSKRHGQSSRSTAAPSQHPPPASLRSTVRPRRLNFASPSHHHAEPPVHTRSSDLDRDHFHPAFSASSSPLPSSPSSSPFSASPLSRLRTADHGRSRQGTAPAIASPTHPLAWRPRLPLSASLLPDEPPAVKPARSARGFIDILAAQSEICQLKTNVTPACCQTPPAAPATPQYVDLLDAQSKIRSTSFCSRLRATGARDYGEDVADRNILVRPVVACTNESSPDGYQLATSVVPCTTHPAPTSAQLAALPCSVPSPPVQAPRAAAQPLFSIAPRSVTATPEFNPHQDIRDSKRWSPRCSRSYSSASNDFLDLDSTPGSGIPSRHDRPARHLTGSLTDDSSLSPALGNRLRRLALADALAADALAVDALAVDAAAAAAASVLHSAHKKLRKPRPKSLIDTAAFASASARPDFRTSTRSPLSPRIPRDSVLLARERSQPSPLSQTSPGRQILLLSPYHKPDRPGPSSHPGYQACPEDLDFVLGLASPLTLPILASGARNLPDYTVLPRCLSTSATVSSIPTVTCPVSEPQNSSSPSSASAEAYPLSRPRSYNREDCLPSDPRTRSLASVRSRIRLDEIYELIPMRDSSLRHGSFSSTSQTVPSSSSSSNLFAQSRHTANTSVDLLPMSAAASNPPDTCLSLSSGCRPLCPSPKVEAQVLLDARSETFDSLPSRCTSTYANGAFSLDDYLSSSDDELFDGDMPWTSALAPRRRRNPTDEQELLFRNSGYGACGAAQLPGLFELLPDAVSPLDVLLRPSSRPTSAVLSLSATRLLPRNSFHSPVRLSRRNSLASSAASLSPRHHHHRHHSFHRHLSLHSCHHSPCLAEAETDPDAELGPEYVVLGRRGMRRISALGTLHARSDDDDAHSIHSACRDFKLHRHLSACGGAGNAGPAISPSRHPARVDHDDGDRTDVEK